MLPAYTMPPNAQEVKVLRALVKHTLSRAQIDRLANDIEHACDTLEKKGGAHKSERQKIEAQPERLGRAAHCRQAAVAGRGTRCRRAATRPARRAGR